jgi:hypothetical protein
MLILVLFIALPLVSWVPFLYRYFSRHGKGRILFRSLLWGFSSWIVSVALADTTFRWPMPLIYPVAIFIIPVPFNAVVLVRRFNCLKKSA